MTTVAILVPFAIALALAIVVLYLSIVTKFTFSFQSPADDEPTPTDVDERALQLADEIDRLHDENAAIAAELIRERNLNAARVGTLRHMVASHPERCEWGPREDCKALADVKETLAQFDHLPPRKSTPQAVSKSVDGRSRS